MGTLYTVIISHRAQENLINILSYLEQNWSEGIKAQFLNRLLMYVNYIKANPFLFPVSEYGENVRKWMVTKHNALYFRIINNEIEIVTIHDVRQNPETFHL